jgi:site-specific DNA recombinase
MKRAIGYIRVSTEQQASEGVSLAAQKQRIEAMAIVGGYELVSIEVDAGVSASSLEREGLQRALDALENGDADTLLIVKLDRLTRSVRDLDTLLQTYFAERFGLVSAGEAIDTSTAAGRMVLNILMSVSQWEREAIGERTKAAMQHKIARGEYTGGHVPYGFMVAGDGVQLVKHDAEQAVIQAVVEYHEAGLSLRKIAARLEARGWYTRKGTKWSAQQIKQTLEAA